VLVSFRLVVYEFLLKQMLQLRVPIDRQRHKDKEEKTMVNKRFWLGMLVMALVFGMTVVGCDNGGGSTSGISGTGGSGSGDDELSLPGVYKGPDELKDYTGTLVTTETEAQELLYAVLGDFLYGLKEANRIAYEKRFKETYGKTLDDYYFSIYLNNTRGADISVDFYGTNGVVGDDGKQATVVIAGNSKASFSSNLTLFSYYDKQYNNTLAAGDYMNTTQSIKKTFDVNDFAAFGDYKVMGYVRVEGTQTNNTKTVSAQEDEETYNSSEKISVAISVDDTVNQKGAQFVFTAASQDKYEKKLTKWSGGSIASDINVYNNSGQIMFKLHPPSDDWLNNAVSLFYDN